MDNAMGRLLFFKGADNQAAPERRVKGVPERAAGLRHDAARALDANDMEAAKRFYTECIPLFESCGLLRDAADSSMALARLQISIGDFNSGLAACDHTIALFRKLNARTSVAVALRDKGFALLDSGHPDLAASPLGESLELFEVLEDIQGAASALEGMGIAALETGEPDLASDYFKSSLDYHRTLSLNPESAVSLAYLSITAVSRGKIDSAEQLYHKSIDCYRADYPESSLIPPLIAVGDVAFDTCDSVQISEMLHAALAVYGASRLKRSWDAAMTRLGGMAQQRGISQRRVEAYRHTFLTDPGKNEWSAEAIACLGLGCVAYRQDRPKIGRSLISRSLNLCRLNGDISTVRYVLSCAAAFTYQQQHFADSRYFHLMCADEAARSGDRLSMADSMCYAAFLCDWLGEYEEARRCCVAAIQIYRNARLNAESIRVQSLLGSLFCRMGEAETGLRILQQSVDESRNAGDSICLALALLAQGTATIAINANMARASLEEARGLLLNPALDAQAILAEVMHNIGELERHNGNAEAAFDAYADALETRLDDNDRAGCAASLTGWGLTCCAAGKLGEGHTMLEAAAEIRTALCLPLLSPVREAVEAAQSVCISAGATSAHKPLAELVKSFCMHAAA